MFRYLPYKREFKSPFERGNERSEQGDDLRTNQLTLESAYLTIYTLNTLSTKAFNFFCYTRVAKFATDKFSPNVYLITELKESI